MKRFFIICFLFCFFNGFSLFASGSIFFGQSKIKMTDFNNLLSNIGYDNEIKKGYLGGININFTKLPLENFYLATKIYLFTTEESKYFNEFKSNFVNDYGEFYYDKIKSKVKGRLIPFLIGINYNEPIFEKLTFNAGLFTGFGIMRIKDETTLEYWDWVFPNFRNQERGLIKLKSISNEKTYSKGVGIIECNIGLDYNLYENVSLGIDYGYRFTTAPTVENTEVDFSGTNLIFSLKFNID